MKSCNSLAKLCDNSGLPNDIIENMTASRLGIHLHLRFPRKLFENYNLKKNDYINMARFLDCQQNITAYSCRLLFILLYYLLHYYNVKIVFEYL